MSPSPRKTVNRPSTPCLLTLAFALAITAAWSLTLGLAADPTAETTNATADPTAESPADEEDANRKVRLLREGDHLEQRAGRFKASGNRLVFELAEKSADGVSKFFVLENLNLERVARVIDADPEPIDWTVSGVITEFRGANYLSLKEAVRKTRAAKDPGAPRRPAN